MVFNGYTPTTLMPVIIGLAVILAILYLLRVRRRRVDVAYLGLWREVLEKSAHRRWHDWLKRLLSFLLWMVVVGLIALALMDPREEEDDTDKDLSSNPENSKLSPEKKKSLIYMLLSVALWYMSYNAVTTAFSRYATSIWGTTGGSYADYLLIATIVAIISYIPIGILSGIFGRKKVPLKTGLVKMGQQHLFPELFAGK